MRAVLYTYDMVPITILELTEWHQKYLAEHDFMRIPVRIPMRLTPPEEPIEPVLSPCVDIMAERFWRNGVPHMMLFTNNEEQAGLLEAAFLPGQEWTLRNVQREAFRDGFLTAFEQLRCEVGGR